MKDVLIQAIYNTAYSLLFQQGNTALHMAVKQNKSDSVRKLVALGANIDATNDVSKCCT